MKKSINFDVKLSKPMKIMWRQYRDIITKSFSNDTNKKTVFIPIEPMYAIQFMSRIRKLMAKLVGDLNKVNIEHHIRKEKDISLGIRITTN